MVSYAVIVIFCNITTNKISITKESNDTLSVM